MTQKYAVTRQHTSNSNIFIATEGSMTKCKQYIKAEKAYYKNLRMNVSGWCNGGFQVEDYLAYEIVTAEQASLLQQG